MYLLLLPAEFLFLLFTDSLLGAGLAQNIFISSINDLYIARILIL
ncbi:MAG: hypothetical protein ACLRXQ_02420 [Phascolarctobacterium faecium]